MGTIHNIPMSQEEYEQDGMCSTCADHVWTEMTSPYTYEWKHNNENHHLKQNAKTPPISKTNGKS